MEFDVAADHLLQAPGGSPSTFGSSGTFCRKLSSFTLKSSTETFVVSLIDFGKELNNWGPWTWKDWVLRGLTAVLPLSWVCSYLLFQSCNSDCKVTYNSKMGVCLLLLHSLLNLSCISKYLDWWINIGINILLFCNIWYICLMEYAELLKGRILDIA